DAGARGASTQGSEIQASSSSERGRSLSGKVTWPDGTPAAGAEVRLSWQGLPRNMTIRGSRSADAQGRTDDQGEFRITGLASSSYDVEALAVRVTGERRPGENERRAHWISRAERIEAGTSGLSLVLQQTLELSGKVVDDLGAPVRKFTVEARPKLEKPRSFATWRTQSFETEDGAFTVTDLMAGGYEVRVTAEGYVQGDEPRLRLGGAVAGEAYDRRGTRAVGGDIQVTSMDEGEERKARVDEQGRFELEHLAPGTWAVFLAPKMEEGGDPDPVDFLST